MSGNGEWGIGGRWEKVTREERRRETGEKGEREKKENQAKQQGCKTASKQASKQRVKTWGLGGGGGKEATFTAQLLLPDPSPAHLRIIHIEQWNRIQLTSTLHTCHPNHNLHLLATCLLPCSTASGPFCIVTQSWAASQDGNRRGNKAKLIETLCGLGVLFRMFGCDHCKLCGCLLGKEVENLHLSILALKRELFLLTSMRSKRGGGRRG